MQEDKINGMTTRHILIVISCCIFSGTAIGITGNCMGQFVPSLAESMGKPIGTVTIFITLTFLSSAIFGPYITKILDKVHIRIVMSIGIVTNTGCIFLLSMVRNIYFLYFVAILLGLANVCFNLVPITLILNNWFLEKIGFFIGICSCFSGIVGAICNPVVANWIVRYGYQKTFFICGILVLVFSLPCSLFLVQYHPEDIHLLPYGYRENKTEEICRQENKTGLVKGGLFLIVVYSILQSAVSGLNPSIASMAKVIPLKPELAGLMVSAAMVGNVVSKILLGVLSDKFGAKTGITSMMLVGNAGILMLAILNQNSYWLALLGCMLYGCVFSCMSNGSAMVMHELYDSEQFTAYYPTVSMFTNLAYAVSVALVGKSYDLFGNYQISEMVLIGVSVCSLLILHTKIRKMSSVTAN